MRCGIEELQASTMQKRRNMRGVITIRRLLVPMSTWTQRNLLR